MGSPSHRRRCGPAPLTLALTVTALVAMAVHLVAPTGPVGDLSYLGGYAAATILAWIGVRRWGRSQRGP